MKKSVFAFCAAMSLGLGTAVAAEHWGYEGASGPDHWEGLCGTGKMQTPVDLSASNAHGVIAYSVSYHSIPLAVRNTGHTVQFSGEDAGGLSESGVEYKLVQVHFHTPSEHVIGNKQYPAEAHFVHASADGGLSVLGVFIEEGAENPAIATLLKHMPKKAGGMIPVEGASIDPSALLPKEMSIYRYIGSLTTPPCSEGLQWHVLTHPITASKAQIAALKKLEGMNARPVQKLNDRLVVAP